MSIMVNCTSEIDKKGLGPDYKISKMSIMPIWLAYLDIKHTLMCNYFKNIVFV